MFFTFYQRKFLTLACASHLLHWTSLAPRENPNRLIKPNFPNKICFLKLLEKNKFLYLPDILRENVLLYWPYLVQVCFNRTSKFNKTFLYSERIQIFYLDLIHTLKSVSWLTRICLNRHIKNVICVKLVFLFYRFIIYEGSISLEHSFTPCFVFWLVERNALEILEPIIPLEAV